MRKTSPTKEVDHFYSLAKEVETLMNPLKKYLGITGFGLKRIFSDGARFYLFNQVDYFQNYFAKNYFSLGEKEGHMSYYFSCYQLWDQLHDPHGIYKDASQNFDVCNGLTITQLQKDYCDFFLFTTHEKNSGINKIYLERSDIFYKFCNYFLSSARNTIARATEKRVYWPLAEPMAGHIISTDFRLDDFVREISKNNGLWRKFSPKEFDCIQSLMQGKSNKMIARDLSISPRTVEDHLKNIRDKLNCKNRVELISVLCQEIPK